jgi:hypothetical protein
LSVGQGEGIGFVAGVQGLNLLASQGPGHGKRGIEVACCRVYEE